MPYDYSLDSQPPTANQRRPEYAQEEEWIRGLLRRAQVAHVGTRWDDQPFVTPTSFVFDEPAHRLIFHSNIQGRLRANIERHARIAVEVSEIGRFLPSNAALEFSLQYRSVMVFGTASLIEDPAAQRGALHALIAKYFPGMEPDRDFLGATDKDLKRTSVYAMQIEAWSGKENWKEMAKQIDEWPALDPRWQAATSGSR